MVAHKCNPTGQVEAERSRVQGQPSYIICSEPGRSTGNPVSITLDEDEDEDDEFTVLRRNRVIQLIQLEKLPV